MSTSQYMDYSSQLIDGVYESQYQGPFGTSPNVIRNRNTARSDDYDMKSARRLLRQYNSQLQQMERELSRLQFRTELLTLRKFSESLASSSSHPSSDSHAVTPPIDFGNGGKAADLETSTIIRLEATGESPSMMPVTALANEVDPEWRDDWDAYTLPVTATHYPPEVFVNDRAGESVSTISSHRHWGSYEEIGDRAMNDEDEIYAFCCELVLRFLAILTHFFEQGTHGGVVGVGLDMSAQGEDVDGRVIEAV